MISVKFFAQDIQNKKNKTESSEVFFDKLDEAVLILIKAQRFKLEHVLPGYRILCLISNDEVANDNNSTPRI